MPLKASYAASPAFQKRRKKPSSTHAWKRSCAVEKGQRPVAERAFHWHPVLGTKKMPSAQGRSGTRGRPPPKRWVFGCSAKSGSSKAHNSSLITDWPPVVAMRLALGRVRGFDSGFFTCQPTIKTVIRIGSNITVVDTPGRGGFCSGRTWRGLGGAVASSTSAAPGPRAREWFPRAAPRRSGVLRPR